jgi:hypothetical protein
MKSKAICFLLILLFASNAYAGNWEFKFFGINASDFKDRKVVPILVGAVSSFVVHELGHIAFGRMVGMHTKFDFHDKIVYADYDDSYSNSEKALFHGGGFLAQFIVGGTLTAIQKTRHSDFNVGFNSFTCINSAMYAISGGLGDTGVSDIHNLNDLGYNGELIGGISSLTGGVFAYIAIDKE